LMQLALEDVSVDLGARRVLCDLALGAASGSVLGLVGPNGSGKSTALRCVYRALRPTGGVVRVGGADLQLLPRREAARRVAALAQHSGSDVDFTVRELVALGRTPHQRGSAPLTAREQQLSAWAMATMDVATLADRGVLTLSGGERQRVLVARALRSEEHTSE